MVDDEWIVLGPASYQPDGGVELFLVVISQEQEGGLRLAKRERAYRPGAKLDDTDRRERSFALELLFHNDVTEDTPGPTMWPTRANAFEAAIEKSGVVGTLHLPWRRNIRCRCERYKRKASADQHRGGETFSVTFVEDNEENVADQTTFVAVVASARSVVEQAIFSAESEGIWSGGLEDLTTLVSQLEAWINAPGEYLEGVATAARRVQHLSTRLLGALQTQAEGSDRLRDPAGSSFYDSLVELQDIAARAVGEAASRFPPTRTVRFDRDRSIYDIATEFGQPSRDLIAVNSELEDPAFIPAGTAVQVFV